MASAESPVESANYPLQSVPEGHEEMDPDQSRKSQQVCSTVTLRIIAFTFVGCVLGETCNIELSFVAPESGAGAVGMARVPGAGAVEQAGLPEPASAAAARPHRQERPADGEAKR